MSMDYKKQHELGIVGLALLRNHLIGKEITISCLLNEMSKVFRVNDAYRPDKKSEKPVRYDLTAGYKAWAETYDIPENLLIEVEEPVVKSILRKFKKGTALDVACGTGRYSDFLYSLGHSVTGIDISNAMLQKARERNSRVNFIRSDITKLQFEDSSFDLVICALVITHFPNIKKIIKELARVVQPSGHIVISDINPWFAAIGGHAKFKDKNGNRGYVKNYVHWHSSYVDVFNTYGLKIVRCYEPKIESKNIALARKGFRLSKKTILEAFRGLPIALIWTLKKIGS